MPPAARITDMHICPMVTGVVPHVGGPILPPCSVDVIIGGLPAARVGDMATCVGPPDVIVKGAPTVFINGRPAARMLDTTAHGGTIIMGCFTVIIGDGGGGAGGGGMGGGGGASKLQKSTDGDAAPPSSSESAFTDAEKKQIEQALADQKVMIDNKRAELERWNEEDKKKFKTAFGTDGESARKSMKKWLEKMKKLNEKTTIDNFVKVPADEDDGFIAQVTPGDKKHKIELASEFWKLPATGEDSKAGTLMHEMSHFKSISGTKDSFGSYLGGSDIYGASDARKLALSNSKLALKHADSFEYWAEDVK
jgi:uncharacterized Zn-binding protein involved in type VI secretion